MKHSILLVACCLGLVPLTFAEKVIITGHGGVCFCVDISDGCGSVTWPMTCSNPAKEPSGSIKPCPSTCTATDWAKSTSASQGRTVNSLLGLLQEGASPGGTGGPICVTAPCPWENGRWPWTGTVSGGPTAGLLLGLKDPESGKIVASTPLAADGSFRLAPGQPLPRKAYQVCVAGRAVPESCGAPGDPQPRLRGGYNLKVHKVI